MIPYKIVIWKIAALSYNEIGRLALAIFASLQKNVYKL